MKPHGLQPDRAAKPGILIILYIFAVIQSLNRLRIFFLIWIL
jgi:hypothetical protein